MLNLILMVLNSLLVGFRRQAALQAEIVAIRHQLPVLQRTQKPKRLMLNRTDRWLWVWLSRLWSGCDCRRLCHSGPYAAKDASKASCWIRFSARGFPLLRSSDQSPCPFE